MGAYHSESITLAVHSLEGIASATYVINAGLEICNLMGDCSSYTVGNLTGLFYMPEPRTKNVTGLRLLSHYLFCYHNYNTAAMPKAAQKYVFTNYPDRMKIMLDFWREYEDEHFKIHELDVGGWTGNPFKMVVVETSKDLRKKPDFGLEQGFNVVITRAGDKDCLRPLSYLLEQDEIQRNW